MNVALGQPIPDSLHAAGKNVIYAFWHGRQFLLFHTHRNTGIVIPASESRDGEIQAGIELTREQDTTKAAELENWLELLAGAYNVLPMDAAAFRIWARLMHRKSATIDEDAMIAAIAKVHGLTVVTRNTADFKSFGIPLLDPFKRS